MAKDPAFLFYSQDFIMGTSLMSNSQIGLYIKLLCFQHQHGGLIDRDSFDELVKDDRLIRAKFVKTDDGYFNERLMKEMNDRAIKSSNLSANALKGWQNRCKSNAKAYADAMPKHMPIEDEDEDEDEVAVKAKKVVFNFEQVWARYPKRVGKKEAMRHFHATVKSEQDFTNINKALDNYLVSEDYLKGFIQNGSTWFNNWSDYLDIQAVTGKSQAVIDLERMIDDNKQS